jgi:hypothetical protein
MSRFRRFSDEPALVPEDLPLAPGEVPIGLYFNVASSLESAVVVTSLAVILNTDAGWLPISYKSITKISFPAVDRLADVRQLIVTTQRSETFVIPIQGGTDRTADAFEFARYLQRVQSDAQGER